jgi:hypothetical protein
MASFIEVPTWFQPYAERAKLSRCSSVEIRRERSRNPEDFAFDGMCFRAERVYSKLEDRRTSGATLATGKPKRFEWEEWGANPKKRIGSEFSMQHQVF